MDIDRLGEEVRMTAVTSRGPGGQNVNKVASATIIYWNVEASRLLTAGQKSMVLDKLKNKINNAGDVVIRSDEYRDLRRNKSRGLQKLYNLIIYATFKPKPRKPTKPTISSRKRRLETKSHRGETKKRRQRVSCDD